MAAPSAPARRAWLPGTLLALVPLAVLAHRLDLVFDDAYITFRYARHLAAGAGLRFNLGEDPPVEGYSNLLWVLWCAIPERLGLDVAVWARASLCACAAATIALVARTAVRRLGLDAWEAGAVALFLGTLAPLGLYATGGLETAAFALAVFVAWERLLGDPERPRGVQAGCAALVACGLRPDAPAYVATLLALGALAGVARPRILRATGVALGIVAVGVAWHVAWRVGYHGDWLPNTVHAKGALSARTLERGALYAASFLLVFPAFPIVVAAGAALGLRAPRARALAAQALALVLATFALAIGVGGDFLPMGRFLLPAAPFAALLLACAIAARPRGRRAGALGAAALAALCASSFLPAYGLHATPRAWRAAAHYHWNYPEYATEARYVADERERVRVWIELARALALHTEPGDSLVQESVGAVGYFTELVLYDQFGLVDREVARGAPIDRRLSAGHDKYVPPSFFEPRRPTWMSAEVIDAPAGPPRPRPGRYDHLILPLDPAQGFAPGRALRLARMR